MKDWSSSVREKSRGLFGWVGLIKDGREREKGE